ncbi:hypothetical protein EUX98_g7116 [Antrodiella citrinella]|uniref:Uncharacterized protein n=1 Tax=Antrodiella citrinella TaxID=2447956 RepID=A0A4S4MPB6_9APHY|nr:hypothetical protein EUX98_g7116 [Antrodiella citrinella]
MTDEYGDSLQWTAQADILESILFSPPVEERGPFPTYDALAALSNAKRIRRLARHDGIMVSALIPVSATSSFSLRAVDPSPSLEAFDDSRSLVFTHNSLHLRNFIVGDDGHL